MISWTRAALYGKSLARGVIAIAVFLLLWELGSRSKQWLPLDSFAWLRDLLAMAGWEKKYLPWIGAVPADGGTESLGCRDRRRRLLDELVQELLPRARRIPGGDARRHSVRPAARGEPHRVRHRLPGVRGAAADTAARVGARLDHLLADAGMSITFVTFLGAFFTIVINVLGGARSIDVRYYQAAQSMGSSRWDIFRRIVLPGTLPSILVGSAVGMGITWEVVVAAEMISGGGSQIGGTTGGGLGFFIWNSYVGGSYEQIVVGMISIGIAGFISSELLRTLGRYATPWLRLR